jgi:hypothetical protein
LALRFAALPAAVRFAVLLPALLLATIVPALAGPVQNPGNVIIAILD